MTVRGDRLGLYGYSWVVWQVCWVPFQEGAGMPCFCRFSVSDCCWCNGRIYHPSKQKHIIFVRWYMPSDGGSGGGSKPTWRWIANEKRPCWWVKNSRVEWSVVAFLKKNTGCPWKSEEETTLLNQNNWRSYGKACMCQRLVDAWVAAERTWPKRNDVQVCLQLWFFVCGPFSILQ